MTITDRSYGIFVVIWDAWERLSMRERSQMILRAYGTSTSDEALRRVIIAMGLTPVEAGHMGISA